MQFCQETNTRVCPAKAEIAQAHLGRVLIKASAEPLQGVSALPPKSGGAASPLEGPLCARSGHQSELAAGSGCHLADQVRTRLLTSSASWYSLTYGRMKNARDAAAITAVAAQPQIAIDRDSVSRPMTLGLRTISIITAMSGAASTPLTTAAQ